MPEVRAIRGVIIDYLAFRSGFPAILEVLSANTGSPKRACWSLEPVPTGC